MAAVANGNLTLPLLPTLLRLIWLHFLPFAPALLLLVASALPMGRVLLARAAGLLSIVGGVALVAIPVTDGLVWRFAAGIDWLFYLSYLPDDVLVCALVNFILGAVLLFSSSYIAIRHRYYYPLLALFALGMHTLLLSGNLLPFILGWELIGLCSYGLIATYSHQPGVGRNAFSVFMANRVGDVALLAGVCACFALSAGSDLMAFPTLAMPLWVCGLLLFAALVKSAQWPFSFWLKQAMVGPTPVSALLHAATLVLGGVALVGKLRPALQPLQHFGLPNVLVALAIAAMVRALAERDLKRMLAGSTIAHMGLLMAGAYLHVQGATGHLLGHGLFKAALFLLTATLHQLTMPATTASFKQLWQYFERSDYYGKALMLGALTGLVSLAGAPLLGTGLAKDALMAGLAEHGYGMVVLLAIYLLLNTLFVARFGCGLLTRLAEGHRPVWLGNWQLAAVGMLTLPQLVINLAAPATAGGSHWEWALAGLFSLAASVALMHWPAWHYPVLSRLAAYTVPISAVPTLALSRLVTWLTWPNRMLEMLPLTLARTGVVAAHTAQLCERLVVYTASVGFKGMLLPVRYMVVDVVHLRMGRILIYTVALIATFLYILS